MGQTNIHEKQALMMETLSSSEFTEFLKVINLVLIPVGSFEQHGPNLTLKTDSVLAKSASQLVASELFPEVLVATEICWAISDHHMAFPGTITLRAETFLSLIFDLVGSLVRHGLNRFLLVNGHSGNCACLEIATRKIYQELGVNFIGTCQYFDLGQEKGAGHAAEMEVSFAYALSPEIIKTSNLTDAKLTSQSKIEGVFIPWPTEKYSSNGPSGPIGTPSAALGWKRLKPSLTNLITLSRDICSGKLDFNR